MKVVVKQNDGLLNYLYNNLDMPKKRIKQYLTHGSIYINNSCIKQFDYPVKTGMIINIVTTKENINLPFKILFEDENIIVVNKPSGLLTIATAVEKEKTLYHMVREYLNKDHKQQKIFIVHRLDKDTSGIVIFAKNEKIKNEFQENWNDYVKLREYTAVLNGTLQKKSGKITQYLNETRTNLVYETNKNNGKLAITNYKVIKEQNNKSLVEINIETGRKNQIRVAFANNNAPIMGDKKYGKEKGKVERLYLHANKLKIYYPAIKKDILFETKIPESFRHIMKETINK